MAPADSPDAVVEGQIITVRGPISPAELGFTLPHEHVMADFIGVEETGPHRYQRSEVVRTMLPHLEAAVAGECAASSTALRCIWRGTCTCCASS